MSLSNHAQTHADAATGLAVLALQHLAKKLGGTQGMIVLALADGVQALSDNNPPAFDRALSDARSYSR
jgi:hypothetical protein